uniref:Uncharacterized protein n=1 Tax=Burkholderia sp. (strain CCGE1003) TaxID=640512 RepID=E1TBU0_BURSG
MPVSPLEIENTFQRDVDQVAEKAIAAYDLTFTQTSQADLNEPLLRWIDFASRYIPQARRQILASNKFPLKLPPDAETGLHRVEQLLIWGGDVNPYQSKTLTRFNDTSGSKRQKRTDGLWADWGIHHLHLPLNPVAPGQPYSDRSGWLLFLMVYGNAALFIDVREHNEKNLFSLRDLTEIYLRNWPEDAERYRLHGVLGLNQPMTASDAEHKQLRDSGVNQILEVDGKVYCGPGMGITTAVTSTRVSIQRNSIRSNTRAIAGEVARADGQFQQKMQSLGVASPEFDLMLLENGNLAIYERKTTMCWPVPRQNPERIDDLFCTWHNQLLPEWAGLKVARFWAANP